MFDKTILPTLGTAPSYSFSLANAGTYEVGSTVTPKFNIAYVQGKYNYPWQSESATENDGTSFISATVLGPSGVSMEIHSTGSNTSFISSYAMSNGTSIKLSTDNVVYSNGSIPIDSKGNQHPDLAR